MGGNSAKALLESSIGREKLQGNRSGRWLRSMRTVGEVFYDHCFTTGLNFCCCCLTLIKAATLYHCASRDGKWETLAPPGRPWFSYGSDGGPDSFLPLDLCGTGWSTGEQNVHISLSATPPVLEGRWRVEKAVPESSESAIGNCPTGILAFGRPFG